MLLNRAIRNAGFQTLGQVANLVLGLLFAGMSIKYLGNAQAGFFIVAGTILGWISVAGMGGFRAASIKHLASLHLVKDWKESRELLSTVVSANLVIALPFAIVSVLAFPYLFTWSKLDMQFRYDAWIVILLGSVSFIIDQASLTLRSVYNAHQRFDLSTYTNTAFGVFGNLARLIVLISLTTMASLAWINLIISLCWLLVDAILVHHMLRGWIWPGWHKRKLRPLMVFGLWSWAGDTVGAITGNLTNLVTTIYLGSAPLPYIMLPQRILNQLHQFFAGSSYFLFPTLAGQGDKAGEDIARIEDRLRWFTAILSFGAYTALAGCGYWLLTLLVSEDFARNAMLPLLIFCLIYAVNALNIVYSFSTMAVGKIHASVVAENGSSLLTLGSSVILIPWLGYIGFCVAQLWKIPAVIFQCIWSRRILRLESSFKAELAPYVSPVLGTVAWGVVILMVKYLYPSQVTAQLIGILIGFGLFTGVIWYAETRWFASMNRWPTLIRVITMIWDRIILIINPKFKAV